MTRILSYFLVALMCSAFFVGGPFKPYPGAKPDEKASEAASQMFAAFGEEASKLKVTVYMSEDPYEKVVAFYSAAGKKYGPPPEEEGPYRKLPSGESIQESVLILDGAADIMESKSWVKIQRPYVGAIGTMNGKEFAEDVRNVTAIIAVLEK